MGKGVTAYVQSFNSIVRKKALARREKKREINVNIIHIPNSIMYRGN